MRHIHKVKPDEKKKHFMLSKTNNKGKSIVSISLLNGSSSLWSSLWLSPLIIMRLLSSSSSSSAAEAAASCIYCHHHRYFHNDCFCYFDQYRVKLFAYFPLFYVHTVHVLQKGQNISASLFLIIQCVVSLQGSLKNDPIKRSTGKLWLKLRVTSCKRKYQFCKMLQTIWIKIFLNMMCVYALTWYDIILLMSLSSLCRLSWSYWIYKCSETCL